MVPKDPKKSKILGGVVRPVLDKIQIKAAFFFENVPYPGLRHQREWPSGPAVDWSYPLDRPGVSGGLQGGPQGGPDLGSYTAGARQVPGVVYGGVWQVGRHLQQVLRVWQEAGVTVRRVGRPARLGSVWSAVAIDSPSDTLGAESVPGQQGVSVSPGPVGLQVVIGKEYCVLSALQNMEWKH